jgi:hypothetical protein
VQAERQWVISIGHGAIAIGFRRAIDIAEFSCAQRLDRHRDVFGRADGEPGPHRAEAAPRVILMLQQGPRHVAHAVVDTAALVLYQRQSFSRLEALLQYDAAAMSHDRRHGIGRTE